MSVKLSKFLLFHFVLIKFCEEVKAKSAIPNTQL